jgi:hypothetical protein
MNTYNKSANRFSRKVKLSPDQLKGIHTLLNKQGLKDDKDSIVQSFTAGRTTSSREMYHDEAAALIGHLKSLDPQDTASDKMRNKIISMAHEMGWRIQGTESIDMQHVNGWCVAHSYLKKKLDDYKYAELPKLVTQFTEVYKSFIKKL